MRKLLLFISILFFSANISAQGWPESSATRPSFGGFGLTSGEETTSIFDENKTESFAGDYITTPITKDFGGNPNPGNPNEDKDAPVPIIESIFGLLGLGGAYAWRLCRKNKKNEE